jgi:hypothetical protein
VTTFGQAEIKNHGVNLVCGDLYVFQLPNGVTLMGELHGVNEAMALVSILKPYQVMMQAPTPQSLGKPTYNIAPRLIGDPLKSGFVTIASVTGMTIEEPSAEFRAAYTQARTGIVPATNVPSGIVGSVQATNAPYNMNGKNMKL